LSPSPNPTPEPVALTIAIRVYPLTARDADLKKQRTRKLWRLPGEIIVFDTETRTDPRQSLTFGGYRCIIHGKCLEEGLFYGNGLANSELSTLKNYVKRYKPIGVDQHPSNLRLRSVREFLEEFLFKDFYKGRALLVAFNHPFDLSRLAHDYASARRRYAGGFSLGVWTYTNKNGLVRRHPYRPRIAVKHIDSKRALIGFTGRQEADEEDLIPEGSPTGRPEGDYIFRGHFLDLRTLSFALTDRGHSLESACEAFNVEHPKKPTSEHGKVTNEYIDYNRRDVLATTELAFKTLEEYGKHNISTQVTKAFSPASIGKGYLRDMGIKPVLQRQSNFPPMYLGFAESAFYGGRTSAHIRKFPVPVVYTDFLSMYPTVNSLMGLWQFVTARKISVVRNCTKQVIRFLGRLSPSDLFNPKTWKQFPAFVRVIPDEDILPFRSKFNPDTNDWQVSVNYLSAGSKKRNDALWFSLPDVIASKLLTGKIPKIVDSFRFEAHGMIPDLSPLQLRSTIAVDPRNEDFFRVVIEQRYLLDSRMDLNPTEKKRLDKALKVLANATSYGIYAEMHRVQTLAWLEKAYIARDEMLPFLRVNPRLAFLHADHRFQDLVRRMKFPKIEETEL
jgi:hypothetical protein